MRQEYFFTDSQINQIRDGAISILSEIGVKLGRRELVDKLAEKGFSTSGNFVRIDKKTALRKIESQKSGDTPPEKTGEKTLYAYSSHYANTYENIDGSFSEITAESNAAMGRFVANAAKIWPNLGVACPGNPQDMRPELRFLRQKVNSLIWCENYWPFEFYSMKTTPYVMALGEAAGRPINGTAIYVGSPLNISGESFDIALEYCDKFKWVGVSSMPSFGASTPLNLIAAYAQTLAETVGGAIIYEALTGVRASYSANLFPFDFYDMSLPFGTPENLLLQWTNKELAARINGGEYWGPDSADIHTNAPRCGIQACVEKASLSMAGAMLGATRFIGCGTLAMDELFSPAQLLLDLEMLGHVEKIANGMPNENFDGDLLAEVRGGLENSYILSDRTLDNMHGYIWKPSFFNRKSFGSYIKKPFPIEIEKAKVKAREIMNMPPVWKISDDLEIELERIFEAAEKGV